MMKRYGIIYADPPWKYNDSPKQGRIQYSQMTTPEICKMPIQDMADDPCALFMWATFPMLPDALKVIEAWGFEYVTNAFTWIKMNPKSGGVWSGIGHWTASNAEICLLARRGKIVRANTGVKQVILCRRGRHSAKPEEIKDRILRLMGDLPRIELFARNKTEGWEFTGNQAEEENGQLKLQ
jgi:site-specific DNA-methyltransferase (adenine-specific)